MIESITYRVGPHSSSDDPSRYRSNEEVELWKNRDTLERIRLYMRAKGWHSTEEEARIRQAADEEVSRAIEAAEAAGPPSWQTLLEDVYAEMPQHLQMQRDDLEGYLKWKEARGAT